jgi:hypothetical protein
MGGHYGEEAKQSTGKWAAAQGEVVQIKNQQSAMSFNFLNGPTMSNWTTAPTK